LEGWSKIIIAQYMSLLAYYVEKLKVVYECGWGDTNKTLESLFRKVYE